MNHNNFLFHPPVSLTNCDKEPIHIPGSIQPHGILLSLQEPQLKILQISHNASGILGIQPQNLLGENLQVFFESQSIQQIKKNLDEGMGTINPLELSLNTQKGEMIFDGILHRSEGLLILELEPVTSKEFSDFFSFYHLVQAPIAKIQKTTTLNQLCQAIVEEVRKLTGFDRVMVYQFDAEDAGTVVAEDKLEELTPYLGLHYPASDIPRQARHLYGLNLLRLIPDVNYQPVELFPVVNPVTNQPLYLSFSVLRSVSPIHIEYLKNMGVGASMSISLMRNQKLWGLIACHHHSPKYISYKIRTACELLGKVMALELASKEDNEKLDYRIKLNSIQSKFVEAISQEESFVDGLLKERSNLLDLVGARGAAIYANESVTLIGQTPDLADIQELINWLVTNNERDIFHTDSLFKIYPAAEKFKEAASGLLALPISHIQKHYILWFRPEVIQTVNWAGNPNKPVEVKQNGEIRLTPRKSFELWQETVRCKSLPWQQCEIAIALELRSAIVGIVLRKADELAKVNQQLTLALSVAEMGIWDWDLLTNRIIWSRGHEQLFGLEPGSFAGTYEAFIAYVYPEDRAAIALAVEQARLQRQDYEHQCRVVWPDGSIHWIEGKGKFFYDADGHAVRMLGTVVEISDRKKREAQLRLLESVVLTTHDAVVITEAEPIDEPGPRIVYVNPAFTRMTGYTLEEVLGKTPRILQGENTDRTALEQIRSALKKWQPVQIDLLNYRKDGSHFWVEISIVPVADETGWYTNWVAVQRDITERKQAEAALQQLNQELEIRVQQRTQALEHFQTALQQQMERERLMVAVARAIRQSLNLTEILNTSVSEVRQLLAADRVVVYRIWPDCTGTVISEAIAAEWPQIANITLPEEAFPEHCRHSYARGKVFTLTDRLHNEALLPCMVEFLEQIQVRAELVVPIIQQNTLWGLLIIHQCSRPREWQAWEIELIQQLANQMAIALQQSELYQQLQEELKERQQVAAALQQSEAEFRSLSENSPVGIFRMNAEGRCTYTNPRCQAICGYTFDEALGEGWLQFIHPEDREWLMRDWSQTLSSQQQFSAEVRYVHQDGTIHFAQMRTSTLSMTSSSSKLIGHVGTVEDVTERRVIEQMKSEFISIVSHELRTPLASIRGSLGLLAAGVFKNKPETAEQMLDIASHDTERLVRLVNDILDLERLESHKVNLNKQWCDAAILLQQSVETIQTLAVESQIVLLVEPTSVQVWADSDRLIQTLVNLVSNAIKFSPSHTTVTLKVQAQADRVLFQVEDRGRGIPTDKLETIFGRFHQVDASDSRQRGGTGLGLAICKSIVRQHGGEIWVESVLGQGSNFYFTVPIPLD
ncbi:PAS domain S-box protein [Oscillatoria sp. FACHB-1406]|uniref:PAS domain S-box protein n=1 Tax=Oscillatoria sp. FACHB-1406 TaxID=2692846 RepID=UPI0016899921|nr:PAS domain S-box protein [Oscillatoria sp. FACHB-1406]MBD2577012.1 PAS domain S-box protein [Oscillatoria sp. FACHB-1406]